MHLVEKQYLMGDRQDVHVNFYIQRCKEVRGRVMQEIRKAGGVQGLVQACVTL